jgi:uncharacterized membrane protein
MSKSELHTKESLVKQESSPVEVGTPSDQVTAHQILEKAMFYQGPVPHPEILKGLKEIDPSYPERVMQMAEKNLDRNFELDKAKIELSKDKLDKDFQKTQKFQILFVLVLVFLAAILVFLVLFGVIETANIFIISSFAAVLVALIKKGARL